MQAVFSTLLNRKTIKLDASSSACQLAIPLNIYSLSRTYLTGVTATFEPSTSGTRALLYLGYVSGPTNWVFDTTTNLFVGNKAIIDYSVSNKYFQASSCELIFRNGTTDTRVHYYASDTYPRYFVDSTNSNSTVFGMSTYIRRSLSGANLHVGGIFPERYYWKPWTSDGSFRFPYRGELAGWGSGMDNSYITVINFRYIGSYVAVNITNPEQTYGYQLDRFYIGLARHAGTGPIVLHLHSINLHFAYSQSVGY